MTSFETPLPLVNLVTPPLFLVLIENGADILRKKPSELIDCFIFKVGEKCWSQH